MPPSRHHREPVRRRRHPLRRGHRRRHTQAAQQAAQQHPNAASAWNLPAPGSSTAHPTAHPTARPRQVTIACALTVASSTIAIGALAISLLLLFTSRESLVDEIDKELASTSYDTLSAQTLADVMVGFFAVLLVWAFVAVALAIATLRGSNAARISLVVSSFLAAAVSLVGVLVVVPLLFSAAGIVAAVLLLGPDSRAWFAGRRT